MFGFEGLPENCVALVDIPLVVVFVLVFVIDVTILSIPIFVADDTPISLGSWRFLVVLASIFRKTEIVSGFRRLILFPESIT